MDEIIDRFGDMPSEIENLLEISRIKQLAKKNNIIKIQSKRDAIVFTYENSDFKENFVSDLIGKYGNKIKFSNGIKPMITLKNEKQSERELIEEVKEFLKNF